MIKSDIDRELQAFKNTPEAVLLDVRSKEEYAQGHIPGSVNIPVGEIDTITISKEKPLYVYCQGGIRAGKACVWLSANGYTAKNIGGIMDYHGEKE